MSDCSGPTSRWTLDDIAVRQGGMISTEIDGDVVALNVAKGTCYGLNSVGSRVWQMLEAPATIRAVCDQLTAEFVVDRGVCEREVLDLISDLEAEGMIEAHPSSRGPIPAG